MSVNGRQYLIFAGFLGSLAFGQNNIASPSAAYQPITGDGRVYWAIDQTIGIPSLLGGVVSAGWGTLYNRPSEYGTHWSGFAKRYGIRMSGYATQNTIEAGLGAVWGEDPRYFRDHPGAPFRERVGHVIKLTFMAENRQGVLMPAYARYAGIVGGNFLSNTWRPDSEANTEHAMERVGLGFLGRMSKNAFIEFWPDVKRRVFHPGR